MVASYSLRHGILELHNGAVSKITFCSGSGDLLQLIQGSVSLSTHGLIPVVNFPDLTSQCTVGTLSFDLVVRYDT